MIFTHASAPATISRVTKLSSVGENCVAIVGEVNDSTTTYAAEW
jgi:hypothetical protein